MTSTPAEPGNPARRSIWVRLLLTLLNLALASAALWLGMSIPSYFRSVSPLVLESAAAGTPSLEQQAADYLEAGRPGLAIPLMQAYHDSTGTPVSPELETALSQLLERQPLYRWSGGPAPFYEQFLLQAAFLKEAAPNVLPTLLPAEHRQKLLNFLSESPNQNVLRLLETRELGGWQRFYPVYSTSGQPLDATILEVALLEQASALPEGLRRPLLQEATDAIEGNPGNLEKLESFYISLLTIGRYANWVQLKELIQALETPQHLLFVAQSTQQNPERLALISAALQNTRSTEALVNYLGTNGDDGWKALKVALGMGQGAVEALLLFDKPVYHPPALWLLMPENIRQGQNRFKAFAETWPRTAIGGRALAFALCGFFLVGILRVLIVGGRVSDQRRRLLVNLDSLVGGVLVMLLVWVLIEPGLLDFRPNEQGTLQIRLAQILPENPMSVTESTLSTMIDQVTILVLLLFFIIQLLVFIFCLLKIAEVRRQSVSATLKLRLLENEENLFDLGLYVGLGGTVASLILVVLNIVDASLMAAYASTLFGIIFVAMLKIGFLRPYRRTLILEKNS